MKEFEVEPLSSKQYCQLLSLCKEFQPYTKVDEVVFLDVVFAARQFCDRRVRTYYYSSPKQERFDKLLIEELIAEIKKKYYFNGIIYSGRISQPEKYNKIYKTRVYPIVRVPDFGIIRKYEPREKELFMKIVRACRDFMRAKMSKDAEPVFFEKLSIVYDAM